MPGEKEALVNAYASPNNFCLLIIYSPFRFEKDTGFPNQVRDRQARYDRKEKTWGLVIL